MSFTAKASVIACICVIACVARGEGTKVNFAPDGTCRVDGKPFFPIGVWVYGLNPEVVADLAEHRFNTVVGNGIHPADLPMIEKHGLMCVPSATDDWIKAAKESRSLLAWYLTDEPEEHGITPEQTHAMYEQLKAKDGKHPAGITHDMLIGPPKYKGSCDFTMTDVYPVTRDRNWPLNAVGRYTAEARKAHGEGWPNFTFIQTFGGPEADGGKWAPPLPHEVRFMAFNALVHRASGILYFSYWPQNRTTWASIATLNHDIERLVPWLLAPGEEKAAKADDAAVEVRAKKIGESWMVIATSTLSKPSRTHLSVAGMGDVDLYLKFEGRTIAAEKGKWLQAFGPHDVRIYLSGKEPEP